MDNQSRGYNKASQRTFEVMRHFAETYAKRTGTFFCSDPAITTAVIEGLALHKEQLGAPLCPCRFYEDKEAEVKAGYWNCPCVPMRERKECHCLLFLTPDNPLAGTRQTLEEVHLEYQASP
jgi:ferredoxin-thioredoxin reductase catalytic chain